MQLKIHLRFAPYFLNFFKFFNKYFDPKTTQNDSSCVVYRNVFLKILYNNLTVILTAKSFSMHLNRKFKWLKNYVKKKS